MESTVEESKATSKYIHEDEFCYVTETGDVFRKENDYQKEKKIGEAEKNDFEEIIAEYRSNFASLQEEINDIETLSEEELSQWKNKLEESQAIGNFPALYRRLDDLVKPDEENMVEEVSAEEEKSEAEEVEDEEEEKNEPKAEDPVAFYKDLTKKAQNLAKEDDWGTVDKKLNQLSHQWSDGPEVEGEDAEEKVKDLYYKFTKAEESYQKHKKEYFAKSEKEQKENLSKKRDLLKEIEKIVKAEDWSATGKIKNLQGKWNSVGTVPGEQAGEVEKTYTSLIKEFKSHKVDRLVEKRQQLEDNLMMKMVVLDKMESVTAGMDEDTSGWKEIDATFSDLTKQWKKIGRVPREKSNQVWSRYKSAQDAYYDNKYKYHVDHRSKVDSFSARKKNVIEDAEALLEQKDIAKAARKVNKLHHRWKKIGNLPQRREDKLWDRFKAATDAFNEKKSNNIDKIHAQEEEHYQQKLKLIEQAEELKETNEWEKGHKQMQGLMDDWKKIGPVPHKKSNKIWKQFKGAMDVFYDRRRDHFKEAKEQQKENLKKKQEILEKLRELGQHEDPIAAVDEAKKLQEQFKDAGYVPIKKKNEMWEKYREVCDVIYDRMRAAKSGDKFDQELAKASLDADQRSEIQDLRKQYKKVKKEVRSLKEEVLQLEESKTNFNFSDENNPILQGMNEKIDKKQAKLHSKENKLEALTMEMEDIKEEA